MHQPGIIELLVENKGEAELSKISELQHIDNATIPKSRKQIANSPDAPNIQNEVEKSSSESKLFKTV